MSERLGYLEIWDSSGTRLVPLRDEPLIVGKSEQSSVRITSDPSMSRVHAVFERLGAIWCLRDLGSKNGTRVNGRPVSGQQALHDGDEILLSRTRIVFRAEERTQASATRVGQAPPELTRRERDVLVALCRPLLEGGVFREPAETKEIARRLVVSEGAVKQHLLHLYDKFGIYGTSERRRVQLANEALTRGAVHVSDLAAESGA
ncbi:MAG TPA: FHA domain-containing protein [Acidimicrobiales bacterium]|nr:FHA domain-containing protein [Acidimicrobiales bacterium]